MAFYINESSIRGGTRGGKDKFSWEDVKNMGYKDREMFLGISAKLGQLDKGNKWVKRDWYLEKNKRVEVEDDIKEIKRKEEEAMLEALGLKPKEEKKYKELTSFDKKKIFTKETEEIMNLKEQHDLEKFKQIRKSNLVNEEKKELDDMEYLYQDDTRRKGLGITKKNLAPITNCDNLFKLNGKNEIPELPLVEDKMKDIMDKNEKDNKFKEGKNNKDKFSLKEKKKKQMSKDEELINSYMNIIKN